MQAVQADMPEELAKVPTPQATQEVEAVASLKKPGEQAKQAREALAAPTEEALKK